MLKLLFAAAALALPALPALAQQTPPASAAQQTTQPSARDMANNLQSMVGQTFEGGITVKSITAEGNTLVILISGPKGWRAGLTEQVISDSLISGYCGTSPGFFANGMTMRVDSIDDTTLKGTTANACPKAAP